MCKKKARCQTTAGFFGAGRLRECFLLLPPSFRLWRKATSLKREALFYLTNCKSRRCQWTAAALIS